MTARIDQAVTLPSGRRVAFNEYGDPRGRPLMLLHAAFFSRTFGEPVDGPAEQRRVRVIVPDRPGVGRSDFYPWTFADYPEDIAAFADALGIDTFTVVGISGGGAHALACAWRVPDRLCGVGVVSSMAPLTSEVLRALPLNHPLKSPARRVPALWRPQMGAISLVMRHRPELVVAMMARTLGQLDRDTLARPSVRSYFLTGMREAVRQGGRAWAHESRRTGSEAWDSWLAGISTTVHLWQGEEDRLVPPSMGRFLAAALPSCQGNFVPGAGHLWGIDHIDQVLDALFP